MVFLRRSCHSISIVTLFVIACCASSNANQRKPEDENGNRPQAEQPAVRQSVVNSSAPNPSQAATQQNKQSTHDLWEFFVERLVDPITWFTGGLLFLAVCQWKAMNGQLRAAVIAAVATKRSVQAARRAMALGNRPRIAVRELDLEESNRLSGPFVDDGSGVPIKSISGSFNLANSGNGIARIQLCEAEWHIGNGLPKPTKNPCFGHPITNQFDMPSGHMKRVIMPTRSITRQEFVEIKRGNASLFVTGKVVYRDEADNGRRTGFARRYVLETERFEVVKDPDYEYED